MSAVGVVSIAVGVLALCLRVSTLVAPAATLRWFTGAISTNGPIRMMGTCAVILGATMAWAGASEDGTLAFILSFAGWALVVMCTPAMVLFPGAYRALFNAAMPSDANTTLTLLRMRGLAGVVASGLLIYFGARAL